MEKAKFTIGSWFVDGFNPPRIYANDGVDIIAQCDSMGEKSHAEELANARLIAAAPELLAALRELVFVINQDDDGDFFICKEAAQEIENARAAIAKATE